LSTDTLAEVLDALIDVPTIIKMAEEKKKTRIAAAPIDAGLAGGQC